MRHHHLPMKEWRWYQVLAVWVAALLLSSGLLALYGVKRIDDLSQSVTLVSVSWPSWLLVAVLVLFLALVALTTRWLEVRKR